MSDIKNKINQVITYYMNFLIFAQQKLTKDEIITEWPGQVTASTFKAELTMIA